MKKYFFYTLCLLIFCSFHGACSSERQTNPAVNASNSGTPAAVQAPQQSGAADSGKTPENASAKNADEKKSADSEKTASDGKFENRCGWFDNPTPANAWLEDKDGEWEIGIQGGYQAEGEWPDFSDDQWVKTNVNYGYGCACLKVTVDHKNRRVLKIASATAKPLSACRKDPALKKRSE